MNICLSICREKLNPVIGGLGMLLSPRVLKSLNNIEKIQPRIMEATFNGNPSTTIICYSPTNASDGADLDTFYNEQSSHVCSVPRLNLLIIGGDMNAQIGKV